MNFAELALHGIQVHTIKGYGDMAPRNTIALMFAACRQIALMDRQVRSGAWSTLKV